MGIYSELDIEQQYDSEPQSGSNVFWEDGDDDCGAAEHIPAEPASAPADLEAAAPQEAVPPMMPVQNDGAAKKELQGAADQSDEAKAEDEGAKRKAHEEAEAKRKTEFDTRQAKKKADEQAQIDHLNTMSDDEVIAASMQRVSTDTEKLTRRNMKECVAEYIQTMCIEDPAFARKTMHPRKSMIRCFQYISRKAWDYIQDELKANGIKPSPGQQGYGSDVPDDLCYQWAVDYFNDPDAKEDYEDDEKFVPKPYYGGSTTKGKSSAKGKSADKDKSAGKKSSAPKKAEKKKPVQKPADELAQLSLGDFAMPEEKAG